MRRLLTLLLLSVPALAGATGEASDEPWRIGDPHGPFTEVAFTTDEGTWLHLDVHPDGDRIVFSLLGDLYLLPLDGGEAEQITSGPAYDVQPRFSPDGSRIAFASDRGGLENLWVCALDGSEARQVSTEKHATVSSPAWTPDGEYLLGRKRITDVSSLGTVELWMWHLRGGEGVRVTKKDQQPDAADPVFGPDGRFLYFSGRGSRYAYNRNVDQGIWQVVRYDRRTGQSIPLTGEFGGAAAPMLSPDGGTLSYVRRDRGVTVLELLDLSTGRIRRLAEGLERDNQEGFAFHGVFPGYAWTPKGDSIVATAEGKIFRWDVETGDRTAVPFTAAVSQRVSDAVRFHPDPAPDRFRARMLRWPQESPGGELLVFVAVGHLYAVGLPDGTPHRMTGSEELEFAPSFSADGSRLAWVTWDDVRGGHVWTASVEPGGRLGPPRRLTRHPGQYANPAFSPDGSQVVYLRGSGAAFRDHDLAGELWHEILVVDADGGESRYVIGTANRGQNRRMTRPRFSPDGERIFYIEDQPGEPRAVPKTVLVSVQLDGTDRREHLRFDRAEEVAVSPDGNWAAFSESHNAWLTAMPPIQGEAIEVKTSGGPLPVVQLTDEGGEWVSWGAGGDRITWIYGPSYHRIAVEQALPEPQPEEEAGETADGKSASKADEKEKKDRRKKDEADEPEEDDGKSDLPESEVFEIALEVDRARPTGTVAYRGARIITMRGEEILDPGVIIVDGDRIAAIGAAGDVAIPEAARVVELRGKTVIPGLFDEHAHLHYSTLDILPRRPWKYLANLAYGITSTHDPSASTQEVFGQAEMVEAGLTPGPRIFSTGFILYGADNPGNAVVESLDDARRHVRRMKSLGAFTVKSYMQPRREQRQWILQAAREEEIMVVPEGGGDLEMDMTMILDGHTTIEHALPITPLRKDVVTLFGRSRTAYTPTLLVAYGGLSGDQWYLQHYDVWKDERLLRYVPQGVVDPVARRRLMAPEDDWHHIDVAAGAREVYEAGGIVCMGGHGQMQGIGPHWEMWSFVQGGMTPFEALRVSTLEPAVALGLDGDLGSLEPGKLADFVVLEKDPLERIENSDSVSLVVKNGVAYGPEELERTTP